MTVRVPPRAVFHVHKGQPYHLEDSLRGVRLAIAKAVGWIDLDCHSTKDGVLVITHWSRPMVHDGFHSPAGSGIDQHATVESLTWEQVSHLRTSDNYRILRADMLVPWAISHGINVELEAKSSNLTTNQFRDLRAKLADPDKMQVKGFSQFLPSLKAAHAAGAKAFVLVHQPETLPRSAQSYLWGYRGKTPTWADLAPAPYEKTTRDGHTLDQLTNYALFAMERRLKYNLGSLTVEQGSYNPGGVAASAGTHDGGGAVDLTHDNWEAKLRAAKDVGFAAWERPFNWDGRGGGAHIHMELIGNAKLSAGAQSQVAQYRAGQNGLANHAPDAHPYRPDPIPTFKMPKFAANA